MSIIGRDRFNFQCEFVAFPDADLKTNNLNGLVGIKLENLTAKADKCTAMFSIQAAETIVLELQLAILKAKLGHT